LEGSKPEDMVHFTQSVAKLMAENAGHLSK
jgi:hypothetical protein